MMTSSVSSCWNPVERNKAPMIGSEPSSGIWRTVSWKSLRMRPASAKLSPSRSSSVVLARRVWSPGMRSPLTTIDADGSIELTSGATTKLITPSASTVGVNARLTPNGLNSTVMLLEALPPPPPPWLTGIGNSPPARKLAVSPDSATSVGSASVVITPLVSSASSVALTLPPSRLNARLMIPKLLAIDPSARMPLPGDVDVVLDPVNGSVIVLVTLAPGRRLAPLPETPLKFPLPPLTPRPRPIWDSAERLTSEKRTSSMTCCELPTDIMLTTLPGA